MEFSGPNKNCNFLVHIIFHFPRQVFLFLFTDCFCIASAFLNNMDGLQCKHAGGLGTACENLTFFYILTFLHTHF